MSNKNLTDITIKLSVLNDLLDGSKKGKFLLNKAKGHTGISDSDLGEGVQSEYNETYRFYKHPELPENMFLRETYQTDSYGYNEHLVEIQFVQGVEKTITVYEPIKS